ncbi:hypothetical protein [Sandaracinobacteroides hominis]|uniref:hypothetical protein n=1 Tax=Sandaracinobacteroides hominis TaxID=2780086 RepID=UPI0018F42D73|nr:hypothetical protein [Sandaracinobacteroides hominis]
MSDHVACALMIGLEADLQGKLEVEPPGERRDRWLTRLDNVRRRLAELRPMYFAGTGLGTTPNERPLGTTIH